MVAGADHVRYAGCDGGQLVVKVVEDRLVDHEPVRNGCVWEEASDLLLEPGVSIGDVTSCRELALHL